VTVHGLGSVFYDKSRDRWGCALMTPLPDGTVKRVTTWHTSEKEAEQAHVRRLGELQRGDAVPPNRLTVEQHLAWWLARWSRQRPSRAQSNGISVSCGCG
jgi:hypothetical protein